MSEKSRFRIGLFIIFGIVLVGLLAPLGVKSFIAHPEETTPEKKVPTLAEKFQAIPSPLRTIPRPSKSLQKAYGSLQPIEQQDFDRAFYAYFNKCMDVGVSFFEAQGMEPDITSLRQGCFEESYEFLEFH